MQRSVVFSALLLLFVIALSGCETSDVMTVDARDFHTTSPLSGTAEITQLAAGDMIEISVEVDGRMEVPLHRTTVNHLGFITLPLVGDVHVSGVGIDVARSVIAKRYGAYYISNPVIMISVVNEDNAAEWGQVSVMGRVSNPGPVPLPSASGIKLSAAIQAAGGFAPSAKTSEIQVTRIDKRGRKLRVVVNFDDIGASGNADADLILMDGDIVNIPERIW